MKLELKHLKGCIDHELKCIPIGNHTNLKKGAVEVIGIMAKSGYGDDPIIITKDYDNEYYLKDFQLLLRPLSDLTKEIVINGKKFIPIKELAKFEFNKLKGDIQYFNSEDYPLGLNFKIRFNTRDNDVVYFGYSQRMNLFFFENVTTKTKISPCIYNCELTEKLLGWHFDIYNLIENGLAIDINFLK